MNNTNNQSTDRKFRVELSFKSLVKLTTTIGFLLGLSMVPLGIIVSSIGPSSSGLIEYVFVIFAPPIMGLVNGVFFGVFSYPAYAWYCHIYKGQLYEGIFIDEE